MLLAAAAALSAAQGAAGMDLAAALRGEGDVCRIYCCNPSAEETADRFVDGYVRGEGFRETEPGVETASGLFGDVRIEWTLIRDRELYHERLDGLLVNSGELDADQRVDLFMTDETDASKYCSAEADVAVPVKELGLGDAVGSQYGFTGALASDAEGVQRGVAWEAPCGAFVYRRSIAGEIFGTDDPSVIGERVSTWDSLRETAEELRAGGFLLFAGPDETYYPYLSRSGQWVDEGGMITIDENTEAWIRLMTEYAASGWVGDCSRGSDAWREALGPDSGVFAFFMTSREAAEYLAGEENRGAWGICGGPGSYVSGGFWLCAAAGSDNLKTAGEFLAGLACDAETLTALAAETGLAVNHRDAMEEAARRAEGGNPAFGAGNDLAVYADSAAVCAVNEISYYDSILADLFLEAYLPYFRGETAEEEALDAFYESALERYPFLAD